MHLPAEMRWTRKAVNQTIWNAASDFLIRYVIASTWFQFIHLGLKIRAINQDDQQLKTRLARRVFSRVWMTKVCHHFPRLGGEKKPRHTWGYLNFLPNAFVPLQPKARTYTHIHTHTHSFIPSFGKETFLDFGTRLKRWNRPCVSDTCNEQLRWIARKQRGTSATAAQHSLPFTLFETLNE